LNSNLKKILKIILPVALGVFLVWYSYSSTSAEDRKKIFESIKNADLLWVSISIFIGFLSHLSRAIRWNYLLEPLGYKPKIRNNILIILISYFSNIFIFRSGEILRATALTTYENVPFEKGFGTIVTERIIDLIMLLIIIFSALVLQTDIITGILKENGIGLVSSVVLLFSGIIGLIIGIRIIKKSTSKLAVKIKNFAVGLLDGVLSIFKMKNKSHFIFHTLFIWACYIGMFWIIKYTVPEVAALSLGQLLVAFIAGAFAMTATNGGLGLYPIVVTASLAFFGISKTSGDAFGWIMWSAQTAIVVVFGAISFLLLPLWNRNK